MSKASTVTYRVVPHDPEWSLRFEEESRSISTALTGVKHESHHIGSTAIPGIAAKPIIDMLSEVDDQKALDDQQAAMEALGYEALGEFGIPGRRYFRKNDATGARTHQVHAFVAGSAGARRHLAFRDYMIAHAEAAQAYGALKLQLAAQHPEDFDAYHDGKDAFIKEHEAKALAWRSHWSDWIETDRLRLRPFEEGDAEATFPWFSDEEVMRFIPRGRDVTIEDTQRRIAGYMAHEARYGFSKRLILHRDTGQAIGDSGLYHLPDGKRIELGFRLAREHWSQGYALEAARGWLRWFDARLTGRPLYADVNPDHVRSQSVLRRLGFAPSHTENVMGMTMFIYQRQTTA